MLEKEVATHFSILAWRIPWTEEAWWATVHRVTKSWTRLSAPLWLWQPKTYPDIVDEMSLGKPIPSWEIQGWSECRVSSVFRERNSHHLAWVVEVELIWADGSAETRRWTQQYLGGQTHHDDPVLSILSASLLQHSTCSEEIIWSCVGDTHSWVAKDSMWNAKFSFTLL